MLLYNIRKGINFPFKLVRTIYQERILIVHDSSFHFQYYGFVVFGILDGHGVKGHIVSQFLAETALPFRIKQLLSLRRCKEFCNHGLIHNDTRVVELDTTETHLAQLRDQLIKFGNADPTEVIPPSNEEKKSLRFVLRDAFLLAQYDCMQKSSIPSGRSGSTCIVCMIDCTNGTIDIAAVGDSRAIIIGEVRNATNDTNYNTKEGGTDDTSEIPVVKIQQLTESTSVYIPSERSRIESCNGSRIDSTGNVFYGPVGIAMTRALGDSVMLRAGVLPLPFTKSLAVPKLSSRSSSYFICLGTDGVFDVLTNTEVSNIVQHKFSVGGSLNEIAKDVSMFAELAWLDGLPIETKVDDITFLIAKINVLQDDEYQTLM